MIFLEYTDSLLQFIILRVVLRDANIFVKYLCKIDLKHKNTKIRKLYIKVGRNLFINYIIIYNNLSLLKMREK